MLHKVLKESELHQHTDLQRHAGKLSDSKISNCILREYSATSLRHYAQCYLVPTTAVTSIFSFGSLYSEHKIT